MKQEIKIKPSALVLLMKALTVACVGGFLVCCFLGLVDIRTDEQKQIDHREELIAHSLFQEAKKILQSDDFNVPKFAIERISCLRASVSGKTKKVILIEIKNDGIPYCYYTIAGDVYGRVSDDMYDALKYHTGRVLSELILEGDDLGILFEEARSE